jgi:sulfur relay protein TusB/DsrH
MSSASDTTLNCLYGDETSSAARSLLAALSRDDSVLILGRAVSLLRPTHPELRDWLATGAHLYALDEDLLAHGIQTPHEAVTVLNYEGWVRLTEVHRTQTVWR